MAMPRSYTKLAAAMEMVDEYLHQPIRAINAREIVPEAYAYASEQTYVVPAPINYEFSSVQFHWYAREEHQAVRVDIDFQYKGTPMTAAFCVFGDTVDSYY